MKNITIQGRKISKDSFLFGLPLVYIALSSDVATNVPEPQGTRAPINQFAHYRTFPDASNREVVGFNLDTLYSFAWIDLSEEPLILSVPEMGDRYWNMMVLNAWNDVEAAPGSRTLGSKGGTFAIIGPNWKGYIPKEITEYRVSTNISAVAGRTYTSGEADDLAAANALQDQFILTPLGKWGMDYEPPANVPIKPGVDASKTIPAQVMGMSAEVFFNRFAMLLANNPPYEADDPIVAQLTKLGIEPGVEFKLSNYTPEIQTAINAGYMEGWKELETYKDKMGEKINGWMLTLDLGRYGTKYAYRAIWTFSAVGGNLAEDAIYPLAREDGEGQKLTGTNDYTLHFSKEEIPPVDAFWSLTIYDNESFLVANSINRYSLSSRDEMNYGEDGSLTIYIQQESPGKDKEANWLPAPSGEIGYLALRLYDPKKQALDGKWKPQPVMKAGAPEQTQVVSPDTLEQRRIVSPDTYKLLSPLVAAIYESLTANSGISVTGNIGELDIDLQFKFLSRNDGREKLSAATGIDSDTILTKATKPDLERVKGVGMKYATLLRASGVNTMPELASLNAANLTKKMAEVNAKEQILKEPPSADTVSGWVEDAKKLLVRKV